MDTIFTYATIIYAALFLVLGILLLTVRVAHDKNLAAYRSSLRIFACAYLLLGITGVNDIWFLPSGGERNYITIYSIGTVSLIQAWLNTYAYLLLQEPSRKSLRLFRRYGALGLPLIIVAGAAMIFVPSASTVASYALGAIYAGQIGWTIGVCRREYHAAVRAMENYDDGTLRFSWMNGALTMTLGLALLNLVNFYVVALSLPLRVATTLFYLYFAIRLLNYAHVFIHVSDARKEEEAGSRGIERAAKGIEHSGVASGYEEKLACALKGWCDAKRFCNSSLSIKTVAYEIGTNHTYLSAYINHQLGCSFQQWLNGLRIEEAKSLFKQHPDKSIGQIGRMVGISRPYNFSRWFKQITGLSPQQWRNAGKVKKGTAE